MKIKVSEAIGVQLDWLVAKCEDLHTGIDGFWSTAVLEQEENPYQYSTDWALGGPIMGREKIDINHYIDNVVCASLCQGEYDENGEFIDDSHHPMFAATILIAAMRCYVSSKLGDEVEIPEEMK
jgi:hypothetical protein